MLSIDTLTFSLSRYRASLEYVNGGACQCIYVLHRFVQPVLNITCSLPVGVLCYGLRIRLRGWFLTIPPSDTTALYVQYGPRARSLV